MIRLAVRTLRHRAGGFLAAFLTMLLGAAMVMACGGLMETGIRTSMAPGQLADADVVVAGDPGFDVPQMSYTAVLPERVRIDADLVDSLGALPGVAQTAGHVFDDPAPDGTLDAITVVAVPGTSVDDLRKRVDAVLPEGVISYVDDQRGLAERPQALTGSDVLISLAGVFGAMALMVSLFGVASMLALSVQQRHRELALLRAVGSTPGQLRALILGETLILAAVATVVAILPGRWLGAFILDGLVNAGVVAEGIQFRLGWIPTLVAIASAMLAAIGGAFVAGRRAANTRPTQALAEAGLPERRPVGFGRIFVGLVLLAGGTALAIVTMTVLNGPLASSTGMPAAIVWAIGLAAISPLLTRPLVAVLQWPLRALTGQPGRLALLNARAAIDRTAAVVAPVIVLCGSATGVLYMQATDEAAALQTFADSLTPDVVVTTEHGVTPELRDQINAMPGVSGASEYVRSAGYVEQPHDGSYRWDVWTLQGITTEDIGAIVPITIAHGSVENLHGPTVALNVLQATELGVDVGDPMTLRMGDNRSLAVEVVALFAADNDYDTMVLPADVLAEHTTAGQVTMILVASDGTRPADELIADIEDLTAVVDGVTVSDREALITAFAETQRTQSIASYIIVAMIVAYSAISVINALASSTLARRRGFGLQRLTGLTRGQVLRMLTVEALLVAVIGVLVGTLSAGVTAVAFSLGRADTFSPSGSPGIYIAVVSLVVLLSLLATLLPGSWSTRQRPAEAAITG
ncbi:FtsX-like permease family protein [Leucobacter sp. GX24907]